MYLQSRDRITEMNLENLSNKDEMLMFQSMHEPSQNATGAGMSLDQMLKGPAIEEEA